MPDEIISHYRLVRKLGQGGMGEVYLAQDTRLERQVALKLLPSEYAADAIYRQRFLTEAKAASSLNHPNVCVVHEVGETADHHPYIVMEYIEGKMLDQRIKEGSISIRDIVLVGIQVADALEAAHGRGVIHRDIKPSNISLNERGQAKVLDFGLAKRTASEISSDSSAPTHLATGSGQVMGTPSYMSPEQALGRTVDGRSDLFSLGVVLYELSTGQLPFQGANFGEVLDNIVHSQPVAVARLNYDAPEQLERVIRKCLEKDPARRYQGAGELLVDLRNLLRDLEGVGERVSEVRGRPKTGSVSPSASEPAKPPEPEEVRKSDIFINCSALDNRPLLEGKPGWVSEFQRHLRVRLEQLTGEPVRICSYPTPVGDANLDERLLESVSEAKTMVSVISPPFVKSPGCQREVQMFWDAAKRSGNFLVNSRPRLFKVMKTPLDRHDVTSALSPVFSTLLGFEFFENDPVTGRVREFDETFGAEARQKYFERIYDLAREISQVLSSSKDTVLELPASESIPPGKVVYLATTSSDLQSDSDRIRRELEAQGHTVLPDKPLPLVGSEMTLAVTEYLDRCDVVVHPIGRFYGLIPEGSDVSMIELQNRLAAEQCTSRGGQFSRFIWIPDPSPTPDERHRQFLDALNRDKAFHRGADLIEDDLESLKDLVLQRLAPSKRATSSKPETGSVTGAPRVYLICDSKDQAAIEPMEDFLFDQGLEVSLPDFEADEAAAGQAHQQNLEDCDGVIVYYGAARYAWVDANLRSLLKAAGYGRSHPLEAQAVYVAPPCDRRKERYRSHTAEILRQPDEGFDPTLLMGFVETMKSVVGGR